jgi:metal-sulfur cluster biosynthetic enzyme
MASLRNAFYIEIVAGGDPKIRTTNDKRRRTKMCDITKEQVFDAIRNVIDPEVGFNLVEMGLIYDAIIDEECNVKVVMTLSTRGCPLHQMLTQWVKDAVEMRVPGVKEVEVEVVWEPEWNISMAEDNVKKALGAL